MSIRQGHLCQNPEWVVGLLGAAPVAPAYKVPFLPPAACRLGAPASGVSFLIISLGAGRRDGSAKPARGRRAVSLPRIGARTGGQDLRYCTSGCSRFHDAKNATSLPRPWPLNHTQRSWNSQVVAGFRKDDCSRHAPEHHTPFTRLGHGAPVVSLALGSNTTCYRPSSFFVFASRGRSSTSTSAHTNPAYLGWRMRSLCCNL